MNKKLQEKITMRVSLLSIGMKAKKMILKQIAGDLILPMLRDQGEMLVYTSVTKDYVFIVAGPRDFQFDRKSGELVGAGTLLI